MRYICGAPVLLRGGLKRQWGSPETRFFVVSHPCLGIVRVKANIIVHCLSTTSQCVTLNDPSCHFLLKSVAAPVWLDFFSFRRLDRDITVTSFFLLQIKHWLWLTKTYYIPGPEVCCCSVVLGTSTSHTVCCIVRRSGGLSCDSRLVGGSSKSYSSSSGSVCQFSAWSCGGAAAVRVTQLPVLTLIHNDKSLSDIMPSARGTSECVTRRTFVFVVFFQWKTHRTV